MLRVNQIKIKPGQGEREILRKTARLLKLDEKDIQHMEILRCSIDARKKPEIWCSYTVDVELKKPSLEAGICRCLGQALVTRTVRQTYHFPDCGEKPLTHPPVIVGMGPAGLFCACYLARHGYKPIVLERGQDVDRRRADVQRFWDEGILQPQSNVQFGEGGAGTFSDGKLNTLVKDKYGRNREVLRTFVAHGAPERILYDARPHMGTDVLSQVVKNMRQEILDRGGQVLFGTMLEGLETEEDGSRITAVFVSGGRRIPCEQLVLAIGHSARDTFQMLHEAGLPMEARPFAVGLRVEHPQSMINRAQYGAEMPGNPESTPDPGAVSFSKAAGESVSETLPESVLGAASYKLTARASDGRGVYSFCMCPGGYVVNASSEPGRTAVNGMSYSRRDGSNANSAIIVSVTPKDYSRVSRGDSQPEGLESVKGEGQAEPLADFQADPLEDPLAGVAFQRRLEERAYRLGRGAVPVQRYGIYKACVEQGCSQEELMANQGKGTAEFSPDCREQPLQPCIKGKWRESDLSGLLPEELNRAFVEGMEQFGRQIPGFNRPDAILSGVESRTSSPVRILRDEELQSRIRGIYPCGEGAGYAGGITSAAMDGIKVAEAIASVFKPPEEPPVQAGGKSFCVPVCSKGEVSLTYETIDDRI